jgi:hypothetical protein
MRTAIYARFSTELQHERSIEDQIELCRTYAAKNDLNVVATYDDRARSGASVFGRDGLMRIDLPLNFHPAAIRVPAFDTPEGAAVATGDRRS